MLKETQNGIIIPIKAIPKSHRNEIIGWENSELKIKIRAIPEKGNANDTLLRFMAKHLGISLSSVNLIAGEASRHKRICISGLTIHQVMAKLPNISNDGNEVADRS